MSAYFESGRLNQQKSGEIRVRFRPEAAVEQRVHRHKKARHKIELSIILVAGAEYALFRQSLLLPVAYLVHAIIDYLIANVVITIWHSLGFPWMIEYGG